MTRRSDIRTLMLRDAPADDATAPDVDDKVEVQLHATHLVGSQLMSQLQTLFG